MVPEKERLIQQIYRRTRLIRILFILLIATMLVGYSTLKNADGTETLDYGSDMVEIGPKFSLNDANSIATASADLGKEFDPVMGEELFKANCQSCHTLGKPQTGPNLHGVLERWSGKRDLLYTWIKTPLIAEQTGDPYVVALIEKWIDKSGKMAAQAVSNEQIDDILGYIRMHEFQMSIPVK